jgi:hypothetical protein
MGVAFKENILHFLRRPDDLLPGYLRGHEPLQEVWEISRTWRTTCVDEAIALADSPEHGLRHGDLLNVVAWSLGVSRNQKLYHAPQLLEFVRYERRPAAEQMALRHFCRWAREIYQFTHSLDFDARPFFANVPVGLPLVQQIALDDPQSKVESSWKDYPEYEPFSIIDADETLSQQERSFLDEHRLSFSIPHPALLRKLPPYDLWFGVQFHWTPL